MNLDPFSFGGGLMSWRNQNYRASIAGSREVIVFPFFESRLIRKTGNGLDIGCGDGELTARIASINDSHVVGLDCDAASLKDARQFHRGMSFVLGHADRNVVPAIGLAFDYAFSNCCLCHLNDEGVDSLLMDLFSSMRVGAELVFLVPTHQWAREMYSDIIYEKGGVSARARDGQRQHFRTRPWYESALERCGFTLVESADVVIPDDPRLEKRYLDNVGKPLFAAFVATRAEALPNSEQMKEAFAIAHDNRKLEIQLFWQRSLFFWGFVAAALVGYGTAYRQAPGMTILLALFGLVCSVVWSAGNRGSKYWQEYWEQKVTFFQHYVTGNIFYDREPKRAKFRDVYAARRNSVSKLTMGLSDFSVGLWLLLLTHSLARRLDIKLFVSVEIGALIVALCTLIYCLVLVRGSKSED